MKKLLFTLTLSVALAIGSQSAFAQAKKKVTEKIAEGATTAVEATKAAGKAAADTIKGKSAEAAKPAEAAKGKTEKPLPMHTVVDSIDASGKSFTHKNKDGKEVKYVVTAKTELKNEDKDAKFEDIKVGNEVNGLRIKKSDTEYEVVKTTYIGAPKPKAAKPDAKPEAKPEAKPKK